MFLIIGMNVSRARFPEPTIASLSASMAASDYLEPHVPAWFVVSDPETQVQKIMKAFFFIHSLFR